MKAHVLFDNEGHVAAMSHRKEPTGQWGFLAGPGQHTATLEIPAELAHLKPRDLHESLRVEHEHGSPRLVAKKKE
jgi:hypothetical protein